MIYYIITKDIENNPILWATFSEDKKKDIINYFKTMRNPEDFILVETKEGIIINEKSIMLN